MRDHQLTVKSSDWNWHWQQRVNQYMNANQPIVPIEVFKHATINTFTVHYRDMMINVGGAVFNTMVKTEAFLVLPLRR